MTEIIEVLAAQIVPAIAVVLASLVSVGMVQLIKWLKLKTGSEAIAAAGEVVSIVVNEMTVETVKRLKESSEDGKLTLQEAHRVKDQAMNRIKSQLPPAVAKAAAMAIGDLNVLIAGKIEQKIIENKK